MALKPYVMYLDPDDPEDVELIRFLAPKVKRKKASAVLREAMLLYYAGIKGGNLPRLAVNTDWSPEFEEQRQRQLPAQTELTKPSEPVNKAAGMFLKKR